jgi:hypothetical protein
MSDLVEFKRDRNILNPGVRRCMEYNGSFSTKLKLGDIKRYCK